MHNVHAILIEPETPLVAHIEHEDYRTFAIKLHGDQRYGNYPYAIHLSIVENVLANHNYISFEDKAAAWLHDTLEDTKVEYDFLAQRYGVLVADWVWCCTGVGRNRKERNETIYKRLRNNPDAAHIKVADRIANVLAGIAESNPKIVMYVKEQGEFAENIKPLMVGDRKGAHLWNRLEEVIEQANALVRNFTLATPPQPR